MRPLALWLLILCSIAYPASAPAASTATHVAPPLTAQLDADGTISVNGSTRRFVYAVSPASAPAAGRPLVIHLHGDGGTMGISDAWRSAVLRDNNGAVFLSAEGRNNINNPDANGKDGSAWRFRMDESGQPYDDVDFLDQLITQATASTQLLGTKVDPSQVYVVGESRGAGFAYYLYADPRTRNKIRAIVPISGTFYCDGGAQNEGTPGTQPVSGSDGTCGEVSADGYWGPKPALFTPPGVARPAHILDIHGQLPPAGGELPETAPPVLDQDYGAFTWAGWGDAAGCSTVRVSSQTEQQLAKPIGGKLVKTYAYSMSEGEPATRCANLDLTFYIVQGGGHVPAGFEPTAWCYLSTVGGAPSACTGGSNPTSDVALSVNVGTARTPISDDIYGLHEADEAFAAEIGLPVRRYGGNLATRYNWRTNATNSGLDYYFANRSADISADDFVARDKRTNTKSILTIPMTGWVAKDASNGTCGFDVQKYAYAPQPFGGAPAINPDQPQCGTGITGTTPGGALRFYAPVNPRDTSVPFGPADAGAWVDYLKTTYGPAAQGGVAFYSLDNEPDLWSETHADLVPTALKYQEYRDRSQLYAAAVKAADPDVKMLGPALGSYTYYFNSFYDGQREDYATPDDRTANGNTPFLEWYLQQMRAYQQTNGIRLLDYLDVHWYPQNGSYGSPAGDDAQQAARLDSVRALWDPTYTDLFWQQNGAPDNGVIQLIPRLRALIDQNYPGTKLAISEYSWSAHADLNGALVQADILGVFGREGVDLATLYNDAYEADDAKFAPDRPTAYAFRIYRNYNGQGGRFGDTGVQASSSDQGRLAIYAAQRLGDGALTLVVINKTKSDLSSSVALGGFAPGASAAVYRYSAANLTAIVRQADQPVAAGGLSARFPAASITLLVVPSAGGPARNQPRVFLPLARK